VWCVDVDVVCSVGGGVGVVVGNSSGVGVVGDSAASGGTSSAI